MNMPKGLSLSGGGVYGMAILGALSMINLVRLREITGTSVGCLISVFLAFRIKPEDIKDLFLVVLREHPPNISGLRNITSQFGLANGNTEMKKISEFFEKKTRRQLDKLTIGETEKLTGVKLRFCVCCLETESIEILEDPNLTLFDCIRMAISVPIYFTPVQWKNKHYIDAGVVSNFTYTPGTLGIEVVENQCVEQKQIDTFVDYLHKILKVYSKSGTTLTNTSVKITVDPGKNSMFSFNESKEFLENLYKKGVASIEKKKI